MIAHHVYTRICGFCTTVLMIKTCAAVAVGGVFALMASPVLSQSSGNVCLSDSFYISDVETSAVAGTSEAARIEATSAALQAAWQRLNSRLLLPRQTLHDNFSPEDVIPLLDYTRIVSETVLPSRYIAVFDYCFDPLKVREFYNLNNLRHAELFSEPIVVLPIWNGLEGPRLWRRPNPWAEAWGTILSRYDGLLDLRLPENLATERAISAAPILARDETKLAQAAQLEGAERVLVMVMTLKQTQRQIIIDVEAELYDRNGGFESTAYSLKDANVTGENLIAAIDGIAMTLLAGVENVWRITNVVNIESGGAVLVEVKADSLKEWAAKLDILRTLAPVANISVLRLASDGGIIRIKLAGSVRSLNYALGSHGLILSEEYQNGISFLSLKKVAN
jgi:hypothetical protein